MTTTTASFLVDCFSCEKETTLNSNKFGLKKKTGTVIVDSQSCSPFMEAFSNIIQIQSPGRLLVTYASVRFLLLYTFRKLWTSPGCKM